MESAIFIACDASTNTLLKSFLCKMVSRKEPFFNLRIDVQVLIRVHAGKRPDLRRHSCDGLTPSIQTLIEDCWRQDPANRPSATEVLNRLLEIFPTAPSQLPCSD